MAIATITIHNSPPIGGLQAYIDFISQAEKQLAETPDVIAWLKEPETAVAFIVDWVRTAVEGESYPYDIQYGGGVNAIPEGPVGQQ